MPKLPNLAGMFKWAPPVWPPRFNRLRTKLTVLYAALFVAILFVNFKPRRKIIESGLRLVVVLRLRTYILGYCN